MASGIYYAGFYTALMQGQVNLLGGTIKIALLGSSYTPDLYNHIHWSQISAYEVVGTGYTAGGVSLGSKSLVTDTTNNTVRFLAGNVVWPSSTISAQFGVLYLWTGDPTTSILLKLTDFGALLSSGGGGNFNYTFDSVLGILAFT